MPPKRKTATAVNEAMIVPRKLKIAKKKQDTAVSKSHTEKCKCWFEKYADKDNRELIGPDGCQSFFTDIGVSLESIQPIVIGYKMKSKRMGYITWEDWLTTMKTGLFEEKDASRFVQTVVDWETSIKNDEEEYKQFYLFTYNYAKSTTQKSMDVETAIALWQIMLEEKYPIIKSFVQFLQDSKPVKVINKDQWSSMLDFCKAVPEDLQNYDSTSSWPVLFDDYVEWRQSL